MTKNDKCYTFLLSRKKNHRVFIKRVSVRRTRAHFGAVGLFLSLSLAVLGIGISGIVRNPVLARAVTDNAVLNQLAAKPQTQEPTANVADAVAFNSGGPEESIEDLDSENGENNEIETEINDIRSHSDLAFMPSIWPHSGKINNEFGFRRNPFGGRSYEFHPGMDIDGERGDLVLAPANGTVIKAGWTGGYGNMVEIDHGHGLTTRYGHMSKIELAVGDKVTRGQLIGYIGSTGRSTGPHLHYELRLNEKSINPRHVLPPESADLNLK